MPTYVRNRFRDGAAVLPEYDWDVNHDEEEGSDLRRNIERTTPTAGVGFVRQQGEDSPLLFRFSGTILHQAQFDRFTDYYEACRTRTIFFRDGVTGVEHEVLITAWNPQRKRTLRNPRDASIHMHYWTYSIEIEVID